MRAQRLFGPVITNFVTRWIGLSLFLWLGALTQLLHGADPTLVSGVQVNSSPDEPYFGAYLPGTSVHTVRSVTVDAYNNLTLAALGNSGQSWAVVVHQNVPKLAVGTYEVTTETSNSSSELRVDWNGPFTGVNDAISKKLRGQLEVLQLEIAPGGQPTSLWFRFKLTDQFTNSSITHSASLVLDFRYQVPSDLLVGAAPMVNAGSDQSQTLREITTLRGSALGEAGVNLTCEWSKVDGPGDVTFSALASPMTDANFSEPGTYTLRLTASDGTHTVSDDVIVERLAVETSAIIRSTEYGLKWARFGEDFAYEPDRFLFKTSVLNYQSSLTIDVGTGVSLRINDPNYRPLRVGSYGKLAPDISLPQASIVVNGSPYYTNTFVIYELQVDENGKLTKFHGQFSIPNSSGTSGIIASFRINASRLSTASPNQGPALDVGPTRVVPLTDLVTAGHNSLTLEARLNDDDLPDNACPGIQWAQIDGPSQVHFSSTEVLRPKVSGLVPGTYHFRATANDGELTTYRDCTVIVHNGTRHFRGLLTVSEAPVGTFSITVSGTGYFTGQVVFRGEALPLVGQLSSGGWSRSWRNRSGDLVVITLGLTEDQTGVIGNLVSRDFDFHFEGRQSSTTVLSALDQTCEFEGRHVLAVRAEPSPLVPTGTGAGTMRILPDGRYRMLLSLPDGTKISCGGALDAENHIPLMKTLYGDDGSFGAELLLDAHREPGRIVTSGRAAWYHAKRPTAPRFKDKFAAEALVLGYDYQPPAPTENTLNHQSSAVQAKLQLSSPEWTAPIQVDIDFETDGTARIFGANPNSATFKMATSTGCFSGSFLDPETGVRLNYHGVISAHDGDGIGYFLTAHNGGSVRLTLSQP